MLKFCLPYQIIQQFDIFGASVNLSYKKDNQFRTPFGGSVTAICFFFIIILCYSNISDLLAKTQVQYSVSTQYNTQPSTLTLGKDTQMIAISYDQSNFVSRPMVNITLVQSSVHRFPDGTVNVTKTPLYLEPCTIDHFINLPSYNFNWTLAFQQQNISDYLCLQKNRTYKIGGVFVNQDFNYIKFSVTPCINSTTANPLNPWNPQCESSSKIKSSINQQSRMRFLISNNILNPEKTTESITSFIDSQIYNIQMGSMYTTANIYINEQTLQTDESIFPISSVHTERLLQFKQSEVQQQNAIGNFSVFGDFYILRSNYSTFSNKSYLKLNQVISYIGGFCQVFFLISAFLVNRYNTYVFYNELANRLYDFELEPQNQNQKNYHPNKRSEKLKSILENLDQKIDYQKNATNPLIQNNDYSLSKANHKAPQNFSQQINIIDKDSNQKRDFQEKSFIQNHSILANQEDYTKHLNHSVIHLNLQHLNENQAQDIKIIQNNNMGIIDKKNQINQFEKKSDSPIYFKQLYLKDNPNAQTLNQQLEKQIQKEEFVLGLKQAQFQNTLTKLNLDEQEHKHYNGSKRMSMSLSPIKLEKYASFQKLKMSSEQYLDRELNLVINRDRSLWMDFKYFLNQLSCGRLFKSPQIKLLNKAFNQISQDLDIFTILNNFKELDKLKKVLLNEDQQALFNFFPKPVIKMVDDTAILSLKQVKQEEQEQKNKIDQLNKNKKKLKIQIKNFSVIAKAIIKFKKGKKTKISCYQKLFNHYQKLVEQPNQNNFQLSLNKKLIDCLGQEMNSIFEVANKIKNKNIFQENLQQQNQRKYQHVNSAQINSSQIFNLDEINQIRQNQGELHYNQQNFYHIQENLKETAKQKEQEGLIIFTDENEDYQDQQQNINSNVTN
ncbi:transmembrane protein, putative (macronuclear) [Tetrahymena thermophila SB210]|uniref:Transmembrane protein, putative n=1 Tax=Tetrahymena thermophila (strain SB210) TaxID=312017 RepID=Q22SH8_TETTS|nr:transmembrane protein, putative [Tetrahymena thermophila SB210]EAR87794.2 transmembrane protein, putative [Tetrahymena thermophila SB210]|eukprot:XP_001008039.2 transmembrane protein, putative [Tetrahymena thermophila SB210]